MQPFIEQAAARGASFHGPLTVPDGAQLAEIGAIIDATDIRATVTATYALDAVATAYDALGGGHTRGKVVVTI
jgi:NADPH:quinone reductase-like Zn-dependent oxidoreductase